MVDWPTSIVIEFMHVNTVESGKHTAGSTRLDKSARDTEDNLLSSDRKKGPY